jgi:hypothetical protein
MKKWIHKRVANGPGRQFFAIRKTIPEILATFNEEFGSGFADPDMLIDAIKNQIYFDSRRDPQTVFNWLEENLSPVNNALSSAEKPNQELADDDYRLIILKGLENVSTKTNFWDTIYCEIKKAKREGKSQTPTILRKLIVTYWQDKSSSNVILQNTLGSRITPINKDFAASADSSQFENKIVEKVTKGPVKNGKAKRNCLYCSKGINLRTSVKNSHPTENCFYGDVPGRKRTNIAASASASPSTRDGENKPVAAYFYDTGATPKSFVNSKPINFHAKLGLVSTADGKVTRTLGTGTLKFGAVEVSATYAPHFSKNLVSGIDIMKSGIHTVVANNKIIMTDRACIPSNSTILATGELDHSTGLLKLDSQINTTSAKEFITTVSEIPPYVGLSSKEIHRKLGHIGEAMVQRTCKAQGFPISKSSGSKEICKCCITGKQKKKNIPKTSSPREICEVICGDEQGPFRIEGFEGTRYNVKFMDKASGYL